MRTAVHQIITQLIDAQRATEDVLIALLDLPIDTRAETMLLQAKTRMEQAILRLEAAIEALPVDVSLSRFHTPKTPDDSRPVADASGHSGP